MDNIKSVIHLLQRNDFLASIDLKDAYLHLPIHPSSQQYLRFAVLMEEEVRHFQFIALPFGLSSAPWLFTKVMSEVLAELRLRGINILGYLDDFLIWGPSAEVVRSQTLSTLDYLQQLGWLINWEKCSLVPSQVIEFLGFNIDTRKEKIFMPDRKIFAILNAVFFLSELKNNIAEESNGNTRTPNSLISRSTVGTIPRKSTTVVDTQIMEQEPHSVRQEDLYSSQHKGVSVVVAGSGSLFNRSFVELPGTKDNHNGCQFMGMGSTPGCSSSPGTVVCTDQLKVIKQQRTRSSMDGTTTLQGSNQRIACNYKDRQQGSCGILKQTGRHEKSDIMEADIKDNVLVRKQYRVSTGTSPKGDIEPGGGLSKQGEAGPERVVTQPEGLSDDNFTVGMPRTGFIRQEKELKMSEILCPIPGGFTLGGGCVHNQLGGYDDVCFSSNSITFKSIEEDHSGQGETHIDCSNVAQTSMVHITLVSSDIRTNSTPTDTGPVVPGPSVASRSESTSSISLEPEWEILKSKGFSDDLAETLLNSRKKVTRGIYQKAWRVFKDWCANRSFNNRSLRSVLEFLQCGYKKGLSVSTLKVQVSALSVFLERKLAQEDYIVRFFQALRRLKPSIRSRVPAWDLNTVLQGLCESPFEPLSQVSDKFLTLKTIFLLAITTARRIGELQALSIKEPYCVISEDRVTLRPDAAFLPKVVSSFHRNQEIYIPSFCENPTNDKEERLHSLDVRRCLLHYLERTNSWRKSDAIFVLFAGRSRGNKASKTTLARWIKQAIVSAYQVQGKTLTSSVRAHSTRGISTSWAERAGASIDQICRAATWSSHNTFVKHYRLNVSAGTDLSFGRKVLQAVVPP
ncbi:uncharacterized protein [Hyperolius riggenbachi]|uniref:uncharacterized protein isoform X1 n=1 Tax=Hyperolius riggenbachi TaxID=752182 RepID=UPI0035A3C6AC